MSSPKIYRGSDLPEQILKVRTGLSVEDLRPYFALVRNLLHFRSESLHNNFMDSYWSALSYLHDTELGTRYMRMHLDEVQCFANRITALTKRCAYGDTQTAFAIADALREVSTHLFYLQKPNPRQALGAPYSMPPEEENSSYNIREHMEKVTEGVKQYFKEPAEVLEILRETRELLAQSLKTRRLDSLELKLGIEIGATSVNMHIYREVIRAAGQFNTFTELKNIKGLANKLRLSLTAYGESASSDVLAVRYLAFSLYQIASKGINKCRSLTASNWSRNLRKEARRSRVTPSAAHRVFAQPEFVVRTK